MTDLLLRLRWLVATVRFRVTAFATFAVVAVLLATGVGLIMAQRQQLTRSLDNTIAERADLIGGLAVSGDLPRTLDDRGASSTFAQVLAVDGRVLAASPALAGLGPIADPPPPGRSQALRVIEHLANDDDAARVLTRVVHGPDGPVVVHVGGRLDDIIESVELLAGSLSVAIPLAAAVLAGVVWWLVGRTLHPVEAIRAEVADITARDLHRRVPEPGTRDEIARLARTMNAMLDRVEDAVHRQQRFVADASHELRSPLTRIRSEIEVDLAHPADADAIATHHSVLEETVALQQLVDDLLQLARADAGAAVVRAEPVDLDDVVLQCARRLREGGLVKVDTTGVNAAQVLGSADQLARAIGNVADNAVRHAAGTVTFTVGETDAAAIVTIADDGPGIPADQRERIFERFARLDQARTIAAGGTGLGLAIAREIVERHGGTISVDPAYLEGARFVLTFPCAPATSDDAP